jgi:hypothetical protein
MAKSMKRTTGNLLTMPTPAATTRSTNSSWTAIATRAFELYCQRGCQDGHDVDDWLQAERELQQPKRSPPQDPRRLCGGSMEPVW